MKIFTLLSVFLILVLSSCDKTDEQSSPRIRFVPTSVINSDDKHPVFQNGGSIVVTSHKGTAEGAIYLIKSGVSELITKVTFSEENNTILSSTPILHNNKVRLGFLISETSSGDVEHTEREFELPYKMASSGLQGLATPSECYTLYWIAYDETSFNDLTADKETSLQSLILNTKESNIGYIVLKF